MDFFKKVARVLKKQDWNAKKWSTFQEKVWQIPEFQVEKLKILKLKTFFLEPHTNIT